MVTNPNLSTASTTTETASGTGVRRKVLVVGVSALLILCLTLLDSIVHFDDSASASTSIYGTSIKSLRSSGGAPNGTNSSHPEDLSTGMQEVNDTSTGTTGLPDDGALSTLQHPEPTQQPVSQPTTTLVTTKEPPGNFTRQQAIDELQKSNAKVACCYTVQRNLTEVFTPNYFDKQAKSSSVSPKKPFSGEEYNDWKAIERDLFHGVHNSSDCSSQWLMTVLEQSEGFYLKSFMEKLKEPNVTPTANLGGFHYVQDQPSLPRILYLGDSIGRGIWTKTMELYGKRHVANIHGAPTNCYGFQKYKADLSKWLGDCPWDMIQFNIGMHYHPRKGKGDDLKEYETSLEFVLRRLQKHSPEAKLVLGMTTPSPFDNNATIPQKESCPNYSKFHPKGYVAKLNSVVKSVAKEWEIPVSERYTAVQPSLEEYQHPCDIHFNDQGYGQLAAADWKVALEALDLDDSDLGVGVDP